MPTIELKQPGRNLKEKAVLVTALLDAGVSVRKTAQATGVGTTSVARFTPNKRKQRKDELVDPELVRKVRASFQDKCLLKSDWLLGGLSYAKADKAGLGETVQAAYKLAELAGIKQPDRTEHFHAVMLKFSPEQPSVQSVDAAKDSLVVDVHSQDAPNSAECKD